MGLQAGRLNKRVTIQTFTVTQNDLGEEVRTWATLVDRAAAVEPLTGAERYSAQQVNPRVSHKVTIRYTASLTPEMRVLFGTRVLEIDAILNPREKGEMLEILCTENPDAEA